MKDLARLVEDGKLVVTPPMKHFQEEKLSLALFWHHRLQGFWEENLNHGESLHRNLPQVSATELQSALQCNDRDPVRGHFRGLDHLPPADEFDLPPAVARLREEGSYP